MTAQHLTLAQVRQGRRIIRDARRLKPHTQVVAMFSADDTDVSDLWIDLHPQGRYVVSPEGWWRPPGDIRSHPRQHPNVRARFRNEVTS
jgi:hypothetical protein